MMPVYSAIVRRVTAWPARLVSWAELLVIAAAEFVIAFGNPPVGMALHGLLLIALTLHAGLGHTAETRRLALALTLLPLMRMLSLTLPLAGLPRLAWYPAVWVPLLVATLIVIRRLRLSPAALGLRPGSLPLQLMLVGSGLWLGAAEYFLVEPPRLLANDSWEALTLSLLTLVIFGAVAEEFLFRGVVQAAALPALGRWSLVYVALLFAVMHSGYRALPLVAFAFLVGCVFAYIARQSGSILGVVLIHGLADGTRVWLMPLLEEQANETVQVLVRWGMIGGMALAVLALIILIIGNRSPRDTVEPTAPDRPGHNGHITHMVVPAGTTIRILRRRAGMTYSDLAQRTGLPARLLAEIETGMRPPHPDQVVLIADALGVEPHTLMARQVAS